MRRCSNTFAGTLRSIHLQGMTLPGYAADPEYEPDVAALGALLRLNVAISISYYEPRTYKSITSARKSIATGIAH